MEPAMSRAPSANPKMPALPHGGAGVAAGGSVENGQASAGRGSPSGEPAGAVIQFRHRDGIRPCRERNRDDLILERAHRSAQ